MDAAMEKKPKPASAALAASKPPSDATGKGKVSSDHPGFKGGDGTKNRFPATFVCLYSCVDSAAIV